MPEYVSYEEFGRRFFEIAVNEDRVGAAFADIAGDDFSMGPMSAGPGGVAKVIAKVEIEQPQLTRQVGELITFTVKIPLRINLTIDLRVDRVKYDVDGLITLPLTVRAAAPLMLRIEVDAPKAKDVWVDVESKNIRGKFIRYVGNVDAEIRREIARFVAAEIDNPEVKKARIIDIADEIGSAFKVMSGDDKQVEDPEPTPNSHDTVPQVPSASTIR